MVKLYLEIGLGTVRWDIHAHNFLPLHGELNESLPGLLLLHISAFLKSFQRFLVTHGLAQAVPAESQERSGDCEWPFAVFSLATALVGFHCAGRKQLGRTSCDPGLKLTWCKAQVLARLFICKRNKKRSSLPPQLQSFQPWMPLLGSPKRQRSALLPTLAKPAASPPLPLHTTSATNWSHVFMPKQMKNAAREG